MDNPYHPPSPEPETALDRQLWHARSRVRFSFWITLLVAAGGLGLGLPSLWRAFQAVNDFDLRSVEEATASMQAVMPWVIALLVGAVVGLIFVVRFRKRYEALRKARGRPQQAAEGGQPAA